MPFSEEAAAAEPLSNAGVPYSGGAPASRSMYIISLSTSDALLPFLSAISDSRPSNKTPLHRHPLRLLSSHHPPDIILPHLSHMVSAAIRRLCDPKSSVRQALVDVVRFMASAQPTAVSVVLLRQLSDAQFHEQDLYAQAVARGGEPRGWWGVTGDLWEGERVDKIEFDAARSTLTVIGNADPIEVIVRVRKAGKFAEVVSIGPLPPPPMPPQQPSKPGPDAQKKPEEEKPQPVKAPEKKPEPPKAIVHVPMTCQVCQQMGEDHHLSCSIM